MKTRESSGRQQIVKPTYLGSTHWCQLSCIQDSFDAGAVARAHQAASIASGLSFANISTSQGHQEQPPSSAFSLGLPEATPNHQPLLLKSSGQHSSDCVNLDCCVGHSEYMGGTMIKKQAEVKVLAPDFPVFHFPSDQPLSSVITLMN